MDGFRDLLYDRLADLYATRGQYADSVAVNQAFIADNSAHPRVPAFYAQSVDVWRMAGQTAKVREARADYVSAFSESDRYGALGAADQERWLGFSKTLGDYYYDQGESASGEAQVRHFTAAADYYSQLAPRQDQPGETLRLAGDAWLQAGRHTAALDSFRKAAYQATGYADAADAGWAALLLEREALDGGNSLDITLAGFADTSEKWSASFPEDERIPQLSSDLANRLLAQKNYQRSRQFARAAIEHPTATPEVGYSALLALGETHVADETFGRAEDAWRKALKLASSGQVTVDSDQDVSELRRQLATSIFRQDFPSDPLAESVSEKLVYAYVSSDQPIRAADELMAGGESGPTMEQQLRAAGLYHQADAIGKRNDIYLSYLDQSPDARNPPDADTHVLNQTFRHRLIESDVSPNRFREQLVSAELDSDWHSDNTLASVHRQQGRFQEAVQLLQEGIQHSPDTADLHYNLAVIAELYLLDLELALAHYRKYRELTDQKDEPEGQQVAGWIADLEQRLD